MNAGGPPDPTALHQLQATLAEGMAAGGLAPSPSVPTFAASPDSSAASDSGPNRKRPRKDSTASILAASHSLASHNSYESPASTSALPLPATIASPLLLPIPPGNQSNSLSLLADASLAAEIDGRTQLTGLDPTFTLSSVTSAIQVKHDQSDTEERAPGLLSKGIVDAETAVELFRMYVSSYLSARRLQLTSLASSVSSITPTSIYRFSTRHKTPPRQSALGHLSSSPSSVPSLPVSTPIRVSTLNATTKHTPVSSIVSPTVIVISRWCKLVSSSPFGRMRRRIPKTDRNE